MIVRPDGRPHRTGPSVGTHVVVSWSVRFLLLLSFALVTSCASSGGTAAPQGKARSSADLISRDEIQKGHWQNAYELIQELRPRWLRAHGADSIHGEAPDVQVRVDDNLLGGVSTLRGVSTNEISSIQFVDPVTAAARWGGDHANGAILISTHPPTR